MNSKRIIYIIAAVAIFLTQPFCANAAGSKEQSEQARHAYDKKNYVEAITLWQQQIADEGVSSQIYYNLANAYSQAGNPGAAVLNYERALKLDPSNSLAKNNLEYTTAMVTAVNESLTGDLPLDPTPEKPAFFRAILNWLLLPGSNFWAVASIVLFLLTVGCVAVYIFTRGVLIRKIGFFGSGISLLLSLLSLWLCFNARNSALNTSRAVIMASEVKLRQTPSETGKEVAAPLSSGTEVQVLATQKAKDGLQWAQVTLNSDYTGWVQASAIERIEIKNLR